MMKNISFEQSIDHLENTFRERAASMRSFFVTALSLYIKNVQSTPSQRESSSPIQNSNSVLTRRGNLVIGDEMLTPDNSRFWPAKAMSRDGQPSFDKQFARDWLTSHPGNDWTLPQEIVDKTIAKYLEAYEMITGKN